tara:strand:- start:536 stop:730 length:195 start_codon:yes stop_codon:yes gene_type:complete
MSKITNPTIEPSHSIKECTEKLVVLIDKLQNIDVNDPHMRFKVDDAKMLAQELSYESEFLNPDR